MAQTTASSDPLSYMVGAFKAASVSHHAFFRECGGPPVMRIGQRALVWCEESA
jgi:hypothetical protein